MPLPKLLEKAKKSQKKIYLGSNTPVLKSKSQLHSFVIGFLIFKSQLIIKWIFCIALCTLQHGTIVSQLADGLVKDQLPFDVQFSIINAGGEQYELVISLTLAKDSYTISPLSMDDFYSKLEIRIDDNPSVKKFGAIEESPVSKIEVDSIIAQQVRFVNEDTKFSQRLNISTDKNIQLSGMVWLLLEPSCIPYDVNFLLTVRDGEVKVKKGSTNISAGYKK